MSFDAYERSAQDGAPVELYTFTIGQDSYLYTSADTDYVYQTKTYSAFPLARTGIEQSSETARNAIKLRASRDFPIAEFFRVAPPSDLILLSIIRVHRNDAALEAAVIWLGRVLNAEWQGLEVEFSCESVYTSVKRPGLRRKYQRTCPHVLYSQGDGLCNVSDVAFRDAVTLSLASGITLKSTSFASKPAGYYSGGFIEWIPEPGRIIRRAVRDHSGDTITITHAIPGIENNSDLYVYPGCDHSPTTCNTKFSNLPNYGGQPYIPIKTPFGGSSVF